MASEDDSTVRAEYVSPTLVELGTVWEHTLRGCWWGKEFGGSDGFTFMGINVPISNCSA